MKSVNDAHAWLANAEGWPQPHGARPAAAPVVLIGEGRAVVRALLVTLDAAREKDVALTQGVLTAVADAANRKRAFREIRARLAAEDVPIHLAADIEQILCETGKDFGDA